MTKRRVLVITGDTLGASMAGPAIRAFEIAKKLAPVSDVRLISSIAAEVEHPDFTVAYADRRQLRAHVKWAEIIIFQGFLLSQEPWIIRTDKIIVADLYDPIHLETLEQQKTLPQVNRYARSLDINSVINRQLRRADYFICASEKQRDLWLGQLAAVGRLNPDNYDRDTSVRRLIDVVPFGVQEDPPAQTAHLIKGMMPGISTKDTVLLWGGGIYNWFDPLTLIHAVSQLATTHSDIRLVFMGTKHPNPRVPAMKMLTDARQLATDLGILDKYVFFNEGWVPYNERANALLDADIGVSTHLDHLETAFSFRTRILDYLWAGLPIIATRGDTFETIIEENGLGKTVRPGDVNEIVTAVEELAYAPGSSAATRTRVQAFAKELHWDKTLQPLIDFVQTAERSADSRSGFGRALNQLGRSSGGRIRQRFLLYGANIRRFGLIATFNSIFHNAKARMERSSDPR